MMRIDIEGKSVGQAASGAALVTVERPPTTHSLQLGQTITFRETDGSTDRVLGTIVGIEDDTTVALLLDTMVQTEAVTHEDIRHLDLPDRPILDPNTLM